MLPIDRNLISIVCLIMQLWEANLRLTRVAPFKEAEEDDIDPNMEGSDYTQDEGGYAMAQEQQQQQHMQYGVDANGNGPYYGGLKGGATALRLRGGQVSRPQAWSANSCS